MKLISLFFPGVIEVDETEVFTFVLENKELYFKFLRDLYAQSKGEPGEIVLSEQDKTLKISDHVEMITDFIGFEPDNRKIQTKINHMLEKEALNGDCYHKTVKLLSDIEQFMNDVSDLLPFPLMFDGININSVIKMSSPKWVDDSQTELEHVLNYMELVRELLGEKLYVMVGMKNYFSDKDMQNFVYTVISHKYKVLLLESRDSVILDGERRLLIDNDICEI